MGDKEVLIAHLCYTSLFKDSLLYETRGCGGGRSPPHVDEQKFEKMPFLSEKMPFLKKCTCPFLAVPAPLLLIEEFQYF